MKKIVIFFIGAIVLLLSSCSDIVNYSINDRVEELNNKCPISLKSLDEITKVEYRNGVITFYITYDETEFDFSKLTSVDIERIINDRKFRMEVVRECLGNETVLNHLFKHLTKTMIKEVDLSFRFIIVGLNSNVEFEIEVPWAEIEAIRSYRK